MQSNGYTVGFAAAVCVICSLLLSGVSGALKEKQEANRTLDRQKNILIALGYEKAKVVEMTALQVGKAYGTDVEELVVSGGHKKDGVAIASLPQKVRTGEEKNTKNLPLYHRKDAAHPAYAYPITGKGLWSTLFGYLAVKPNGKDIVGITFYKHGETPGLGGEIERQWFQKNFVGKTLYDGDKLVGIKVAKGKAKDHVEFKTQASHMVDGISGATLTGNGVTKLMKREPARYEAFFKALSNAPKTGAAGTVNP